jgi:hypothetical protein
VPVNVYSRNKYAPAYFGALGFTPQLANPIAPGNAGFWYDGQVLWFVDAFGRQSQSTSTVIGCIPVRAATTAALPACTYTPPASAATGYQTSVLVAPGFLQANANGALGAQDGVTLKVGDRLLVWNQATASQNGIYMVTQLGGASAPWVLARTGDADVSANFVTGALIPVGPEGALYGKVTFTLATPAPIVLDTTALTFTVPAPRVATVAFSATPAFSAAPFQHIKLTGNITGWTLAAGVNGQEITIYFEQDGTGNRTLAGTPANVRLAGNALTLSTGANKVDALTLAWDEALGTPKWVEICRALNF